MSSLTCVFGNVFIWPNERTILIYGPWLADFVANNHWLSWPWILIAFFFPASTTGAGNVSLHVPHFLGTWKGGQEYPLFTNYWGWWGAGLWVLVRKDDYSVWRYSFLFLLSSADVVPGVVVPVSNRKEKTRSPKATSSHFSLLLLHVHVAYVHVCMCAHTFWVHIVCVGVWKAEVAPAISSPPP